MNPQDLSAYITNLLRSGPEAITSFLMGVFFTGMVVYALRRWLFVDRLSLGELAKKDAEIARREAELARKDILITRAKARSANLEGAHQEKDRIVESLRQENASLRAASARLDAMEVENRRLLQAEQSLGETIQDLKRRLSEVVEERDHFERWWNRSQEGTPDSERESVA